MYCGDGSVASVVCVGNTLLILSVHIFINHMPEPCTDNTVRLSGSSVENAG